MYEPMRIVVAGQYYEAESFIGLMDNEESLYRYLPEHSLPMIEGFKNIIILLMGDYESREDIQEILEYAFHNSFPVYAMDFTEIETKRAH